MFDTKERDTDREREGERGRPTIVGGYVLHFVILFAALLSTVCPSALAGKK